MDAQQKQPGQQQRDREGQHAGQAGQAGQQVGQQHQAGQPYRAGQQYQSGQQQNQPGQQREGQQHNPANRIVDKMREGMGSMREGEEGPVAERIESMTSRLPSDTFLWSALGAMGTSMALRLAGREEAANFVGTWVPTILIFGLYNKIVKVAGHDREDARYRSQGSRGQSEGWRSPSESWRNPSQQGA